NPHPRAREDYSAPIQSLRESARFQRASSQTPFGGSNPPAPTKKWPDP
ncbi:MAG: hypothetical protein ACI84D_002077, partial [Thalassolituus oleivorans]